MHVHPSTFEYLTPTKDQLQKMSTLREAATEYAEALYTILPEGADKTYTIRKLREVAMWANVAVTRQGNGEPRPAIGDYPATHPVEGDLGSVPL